MSHDSNIGLQLWELMLHSFTTHNSPPQDFSIEQLIL